MSFTTTLDSFHINKFSILRSINFIFNWLILTPLPKKTHRLIDLLTHRLLTSSPIVANGTTSTLNLEVSRPRQLYFETKIFSIPSLSASAMRASILLTERISPESPTSAAKAYLLLISTSSFDDNIAATTARSMAGSSTRIPPAMLRKTSFVERRNPALFSSTASSILSRRVSKPVQLRCGVP